METESGWDSGAETALEILTCTRASDRSSLMASSSRVNTSGYCVFSKARSSWCSWYVVKVVRERRTCGRGAPGHVSFKREKGDTYRPMCLWRPSNTYGTHYVGIFEKVHLRLKSFLI